LSQRSSDAQNGQNLDNSQVVDVTITRNVEMYANTNRFLAIDDPRNEYSGIM